MQLLNESARRGVAGLFKRHLLSSLAQGRAEGSQELLFLELLTTIVPDLSPVYSLKGSNWMTLPVLTTHGKAGGRLVYLLAGLLAGKEGSPSSIGLSSASRHAIQTACAAYSNLYPTLGIRFVAIPLIREDSPPLSGCSLALSVAFARYLLDRKLPWPAGIYASGCLQAEGRVTEVDGMTEKCRLAALNKGRAMFVATSNCCRTSPIVQIPCESLQRALDDLDYLLLENDPRILNEFKPFLVSEKRLLTYFPELPLAVLQHPACVSTFVNIRKNPGGFLQSAVEALRSCSFDAPRIAKLDSLFSIDTLKDLVDREGGQTVLAAYEWCINRIACANHLGDTCSVATWKEFQRSLEDMVSAEKHLAAWNHLFIAERFNRFYFSPEIPEDIQQLIDEEEARNREYFRPNKNLGAMYGTLSQNYGFCGPQCFVGLEEFAVKAEKSFDKEFDKEKLRLLLYRVFGLLDRKEYTKAELWLDRYFGLVSGGVCGHAHWLESALQLLAGNQEGGLFALHMVLRALADMKIQLGKERLINLAAELNRRMPRHVQHPWQLILISLASLFGESGLIGECRTILQRAIAICLGGGETMQAMALLMYAELQIRGQIGIQEKQAAEELRRRILASRYLDQNHFFELQAITDTGEMLEYLYRHRSTLFPFTYR